MHANNFNEGQIKGALIVADASLNCAEHAKGIALPSQQLNSRDCALANLTEPAPSPTLVERSGREDSAKAEGGEPRVAASTVNVEPELLKRLLERAGVAHSHSAMVGKVLGTDSCANLHSCDEQLQNEASITRLHDFDSLRALVQSSAKCSTQCACDPAVQAELLQFCKKQPALNVICFTATGAKQPW